MEERKLATCTAVDLMVTYRPSIAPHAVGPNRRLFLAEGPGIGQTNRRVGHCIICVSIHQLLSSRRVERMARLLAAADMDTHPAILFSIHQPI
jgi:hypothetical protein